MIKIRYAAPAAVIAALSLGAVAASAAPAGIGTHESKLGTVLTDANGMTLYTFAKDKDGMSACYGQCAANWPPLLAASGAKADGAFGLTKRTDGSEQWTYNNMPLYLWVRDQKPGDTTGNGFAGGAWKAAMAK